MDSVALEQLGKCYRLGNRGPAVSPPEWLGRLFRRQQPTAKRRAPREIWAVRDVSFTVQPGTILGVIGPNGAGKTTLLKLLARVTLPTEGRAVVRGRVGSLLALGAGFQPDLTGRENIMLQAGLYGIPRTEVERRIGAIAEFAEIGDFIDTQVRRYSSGMYVRLAFSVAINMEPDVLLADEVLAVGDIGFQERCLQRVEQAGSEGLTVLFVSHDMGAIARLCHRVIWLDHGRVVADGPPDEVVARYEQSSWERVTVTSQKSKSGSHINAHGEVLATRLLSDDDKEIGAVRRSEPATIQMLFRMDARRVTVRCAVAVYTRGILAFRSVQPFDMLIDEKGIYSASVSVPADFLSDATYTVKAGVWITDNGVETAIVQDDALTFKVYSGDDANAESLLVRGTYGQASGGVVSPRLEWNVIPEPARASA